ncbi:MAG: type I restriction enzyme HsdR N-terminal domain-containing protein [Bacteroidia bacterium]|nr:type I restriction enzyme HsdR N-terminal domain-containing protein [Bacteroidia bacterium]
MDLPRLHFPEYNFKLQRASSGQQSLKIFDIIRRKYVVLSPEEWVRQHLIHFLLNDRKFPKALTGVERKVMVNRMARRFDVLVYSRNLKPLLLAECKAPEVRVSQEVFDQAARYNLSLEARYFVLTNGFDTYCCTRDEENKAYRYLEEVPLYENL